MGAPPTHSGNETAPRGLPPSRPRTTVLHTFRALRHRNFRLFIGGQIISLVGTWMQVVAQSWLVYRLTHSELLSGAAWFCSGIAVFVLGPLGGLAADRFPRHKVVLPTRRSLCCRHSRSPRLRCPAGLLSRHVLALAGLLGVINASDMPGRQALVIQMTSKDDLINAISLNSAVFNAARVVGPGVAGMLVAWWGRHVLPDQWSKLSGRNRLPAGDAPSSV
jgi:MFS family permease